MKYGIDAESELSNIVYLPAIAGTPLKYPEPRIDAELQAVYLPAIAGTPLKFGKNRVQGALEEGLSPGNRRDSVEVLRRRRIASVAAFISRQSPGLR